MNTVWAQRREELLASALRLLGDIAAQRTPPAAAH
jgi:hypothetical protein